MLISLFIFLDDTDKEVSWRESMENVRMLHILVNQNATVQVEFEVGEGPLCGRGEIFPWRRIPRDTAEIAI